jgi:hypothetical protein
MTGGKGRGPGRATETVSGSLDCAIKVPLGDPITQSSLWVPFGTS